MKSKNKITMIACFAAAGVLVLALVLMIAFDKGSAAGQDPIQQLPGDATETTSSVEETTEETQFVEIPTAENTEPESTTESTEPDATTKPTEPDATTKPTTPGGSGDKPAEEEEGDIEIEIGVEDGSDSDEGNNDGNNDSGNNDSGNNGGGNNVIEFDDLWEAANG